MWPDHPVGATRYCIPDRGDVLSTRPEALVRPVLIDAHRGDGCVIRRQGWAGRLLVPVSRLFVSRQAAGGALLRLLEELEAEHEQDGRALRAVIGVAQVAASHDIGGRA